MRRFPSSWDKTLAALGFRRRVTKVKRDTHRWERPRIESLERREMLAGDTPVLLRPEYFVVESGEAAPPFVVATEYDESGSPSARVSLLTDAIDTPSEVQSLQIELRLGDQVLETQEISVSLAPDSFQEAFYEDRKVVVRQKLRPAEESQILAWVDQLSEEGEFADLGAASADEALRESATRLASIASLHDLFDSVLDSEPKRAAFYQGVLRSTEAAATHPEGQIKDDAVADLGRLALLASEQLSQDLGSAGSIGYLSAGARDALLGVVSPYYTVMGVYGVDEVLRSVNEASQQSVLAVVEDGELRLGDRLRLDVGPQEAFVEATVKLNSLSSAYAASQVTITGASIDDATTWDDGSLGFDDTATVFVVGEWPGNDYPYTGHVRADLAAENGKTPTSATLKLDLAAGSAADAANVRLTPHWDAWGLAYDEAADAESGGWVSSQLDSDSGRGSVSPTRSDSQTFEFDVTEAVQRSLLLGDANADGRIDHDPTQDGQRRALHADIEATYLAIRDWNAYAAAYGGAHSGAGELVYRVDANWDGVASPRDGQRVLERLGVAPGDFNLDGVVDTHDFNAYSRNYGRVARQFSDGDADFNGVVNAYDEDLWDLSDYAEESFRNARPGFSLSLASGSGAVSFVSTEETSGQNPELDLAYSTPEVRIVDVHALGGVAADGEVVVEYELPYGAVPGDEATLQLLRLPSDGSGPVAVGSAETLAGLDPLAGVQTHRFGGALLNAIEPGDRIAVVVQGAGFQQTVALSEGIVYGTDAKVHVFGGGFNDFVSVDSGSIGLTLGSGLSHTTPTLAFSHVAANLAGGDDFLMVESAFTGELTIDGGRGDDDFFFDTTAGEDRTIYFEDTKGNNAWRILDAGNALGKARIDGLESLDVADAGLQVFSLSYLSHSFSSVDAGEYQVRFKDDYSINRVVADSYSADLTEYSTGHSTLTVDVLSDVVDDDYGDGQLSLREALTLAEHLHGEQTIEFNEELFFSGPQTIRLGNGAGGPSEYLAGVGTDENDANAPTPLVISSSVQINGPGAGLLTIDGRDLTRVFTVGAFVSGQVAIRDLTVARGRTGSMIDGAGLYAANSGGLLLERTVWAGNVAGGDGLSSGRGGALYLNGVDATILESSFSENHAQYGGAIYAGNADVSVHQSLLESNGAKWGGALYRYDSLEGGLLLSGSTLANNLSTGAGSALFIHANSGLTTIQSTTISGNQSSGKGGAVYFSSTSSTATSEVEILGSTITENRAKLYYPAGVWSIASRPLEISNSIVAQNYQGTGSSRYDLRSQFAASVFTGSHNLYGNFGGNQSAFSGFQSESTNLALPSSESAGLLPLGDYGGPTPTHPLKSGSPAIDQGDPSRAGESDQRGDVFARGAGGPVDIGAVETRSLTVGAVYKIFGTEGNDDLLIAPGVIYVGGVDGVAIPYDAGGLPIEVHALGGNDTIALMPGLGTEHYPVRVFGGEGDDLIYGSSERDELHGGIGDDQLFGRGGEDELYGDGGEDQLYGGEGADTLHGGEQGDLLFGGAGADQLHGNAGDDYLDGGSGSDTLYGGLGSDDLHGGHEPLTADGFPQPVTDGYYGDHEDAEDSPTVGGVDRYHIYENYGLEGSQSFIDIRSFDGEDTIDFSRWNAAVKVDLTAADAVSPFPKSLDQDPDDQGYQSTVKITIFSTPGLDLVGGAGDDDFKGDAGVNRLIGRGGDDKLEGGGGVDAELNGDELLGGAGNDTLLGWEGAVLVDGGYGDDVYQIYSFGAIDTVLQLRDAEGVDRLEAATDWSTNASLVLDLAESEPQSVLRRDTDIQSVDTASLTVDLPGSDVIEDVIGSPNADWLRGNGLVNVISGGAGDDVLLGTAEDFLEGGDGLDSIEARSVTDAGEGFNGTQKTLSDTETQNYLFADLPAGEYRVYTTWASQEDASGDYVVSVGEEDAWTDLPDVTLDQSIAPHGNENSGRPWELLASGVTVVAGQGIHVRLTAAAGGTAVADAVRLERVERRLEVTALDSLGDPVVGGIQVGADLRVGLADPILEQLSGAPTVEAKAEFLGQSPLALNRIGSTDEWSVTLASLPAAAGYYPITVTATDDQGAIGSTTVLLKVGSPVQPPAITVSNSAGSVDEGSLYELVVTTNTADVELAGDYPVGLVPVSHAVEGATHTHTFHWTPGESDDGTYDFFVRATTDAGDDRAPLRHVVPVSLEVVEVNNNATVRLDGLEPEFAFAYSDATTPDLNDPSFQVTLLNDGGFDDVRLVVDWTYDASVGFQSDQVVYGESATRDQDEWQALITPNSSSDFAQSLGVATQVAFRVEERKDGVWEAEQDGLGNEVIYSTAAMAYTPVATSSLAISGLRGVDQSGADLQLNTTDYTYHGSYISLVGQVTNETNGASAGRVERLEVRIYYTDDLLEEANRFLGVATTDANGEFEFVPRHAWDATGSRKLRVEVSDPAPTVSPSDRVDVSQSLDFTLDAATAPAFVADSVLYTEAPVLEGLSIVRQPRVVGQVTPAVAGVAVAIDYSDDESIGGVAVTNEAGEFTIYINPPEDFDLNNLTAEVLAWDEFLRAKIGTTAVTVSANPDPAASMPSINSLIVDSNHDGVDDRGPTGDGAISPDARLSGTIPEAGPGVVVQFFASDPGESFDPERMLGFAITDEQGAFEFFLPGLADATSYDLHARTVARDPVNDTAEERAVILGALWGSGEFENNRITISGSTDEPEIGELRLAYDTGSVADRTAIPTVTGLINYAGDPRDVDVEIDIDGDGVADVTVFPEADGSFIYTPEGLSAGQDVHVTAWAVVHDFENAIPDLDPAFLKQLEELEQTLTVVDGEVVDFDAELAGDQAEAWLDELFGVKEGDNWYDVADGFQGDWYNADYETNWDLSLPTDTESFSSISFTYDPTQAVSYNLGDFLQVGEPANPSFTAQLQGNGPVADQVVLVYLAGASEPDGEAWTDEEGRFSYTLKEATVSDEEGIALRFEVLPELEDGTQLDTAAVTQDSGHKLDVVAGLTSAYSVSIRSGDVEDLGASGGLSTSRRPDFRGEVTLPEDADPAGWLVQFDVNGDGIADGHTFTDGDGEYSYRFTEWPGPLAAGAEVTIRARLAKRIWSDLTETSHLVFGEWSNDANSVTWEAPTESPTITRLELATDTGSYDLGATATGVEGERFLALDRVTSDPTITGVVENAAPFSVIEFSHRGDGVVDGTATVDEYGRFTYTPYGLDYGHWDLQARVKLEVVTSDPQQGWASMTATGDPDRAGSSGFTLVAPSRPQVLINDGVSSLQQPTNGKVTDPRFVVTVADADEVSGVFVDFFVGGQYVGTAPVEIDGQAVYAPPFVGVLSGDVSAVPWKSHPVTGERVEGTGLALSTALSVEPADSFGVTTEPAELYGDDSLDSLAPTFTGKLNVPDGVVPQYVEVEVVYVVDGVEVDRVYDATSVVAAGTVTGTSTSTSYHYGYTPNLSRWRRGLHDSGDVDVKIRVRPVGYDSTGAVVGTASEVTSLAVQGTPTRQYATAELFLTSPYDPLSGESLGSGSGSQQTSTPSLTGSVTASIALGEKEEEEVTSWRQSVHVVSTYLEIDYSDGSDFDGVGDVLIPIEDPTSFEIDLTGLPYGPNGIKARVVEEVRVSHLFEDDQSYKNEFQSGDPVLVPGGWQDYLFAYIDPRPVVTVESIGGLSQVDPDDPETNPNPTPSLSGDLSITGSISSAYIEANREGTEADDLGGLLLEFDHDGDGVADGTVYSYSDGSFEYEPIGLPYGELVLRVRASDPYFVDGESESDWIDLPFTHAAVSAPGVPSLEAESPLSDTIDGRVRIDDPVFAGNVVAEDSLESVRVEFDYNGDGAADVSTYVEDDGAYRHVASLPSGESDIRVRAVGYYGEQQLASNWSEPLGVFYLVAGAPVIAAVVGNAETGELRGRATIEGYGASTLVEVLTISGPEDTEHRSYVRTEASGAFTYTPPRLVYGANGTHTIWVRGIDGGAVGEWNSLSSLQLGPPATAFTPGDGYGLTLQVAYGETVTATPDVYADPTIRGQLSGSDFTQAYVDLVLQNPSDVEDKIEATLPVSPDGVFVYTPTDLRPGVVYAVTATEKQWDPNSGAWWEGSGDTLDLGHDPTAGSAPTVAALDYWPEASSGFATFRGTVTGDGALGGLTVRFDHNGDGVADGYAVTHYIPGDPNASFTYVARGVEPAAASQELQAWVEPPAHQQIAPATPTIEAFIHAAGLALDSDLRVADLGITAGRGRIGGRVVGNTPADAVIEYRIVEPGPLYAAGDSPLAAETTGQVDAGTDGHFFVDIESIGLGVASLYVRPLLDGAVGEWTQYDFNREETAASQTYTINDVRVAAPLGGDNQSTDAPSVVGRLGENGEGAFGLVQVNVVSGDSWTAADPYIAKVTADGYGEFRFTLPNGSPVGEYTIELASIAIDGTVSETITTFDFELEPSAPEFAGDLQWNDPVLTGSIQGAGRAGGVRIEFNHGDGQSVDGYAYTAADGSFSYTPVGLEGPAAYNLSARIVTYDPQTGEFVRPGFDESVNSVASLSLSLMDTVSDDISFDGVVLSDLSSDALALAGYEDAVVAALANAGMTGSQAGASIDVGVGSLSLLHRGGGEEGGLGGDVFAVSGAPTPTVVSLGDQLITNLVTPEGGTLNGSYDVGIELSASGVAYVQFVLHIDSYTIESTTSGEADDFIDATTKTELVLSDSEYFFEFWATEATYQADILTQLTHVAREAVDYQYTVTETNYFEDPSNPTGEPVAVGVVVEGGSDYEYRLGEFTIDGGQATATAPAVYDTNAPVIYDAPLSVTRTRSLTNGGAASGSPYRSIDAGPAAANSYADSGSTRDAGNHTETSVSSTYEETITKTGSFAGLDSATGTITVSIEETVETTSTTNRVIRADGELSSEVTERTSTRVRSYSGSATYTDGGSLRGSASLTESRLVELTVEGRGSSSSTEDSSKWEYSGLATVESTYSIAGDFSESLSGGTPSNTLSASGVSTDSTLSNWTSEWEATARDSSDGSSGEYGGGSRFTRNQTASTEFQVSVGADGSSIGGKTESNGFVFNKDWASGEGNASDDNGSTFSKGRTLTQAQGDSEVVTTFSYDTLADGSETFFESTDYDVEADAISRSGSSARGWATSGEDRVTFFSTSSNNAGIEIESSGTVTRASDAETTRSGFTRQKTTSDGRRVNSSETPDTVGTTWSAYDEALTQTLFFNGQDVDGFYENESRSFANTADFFVKSSLAGVAAPDPREEPSPEDFVGSRILSGGYGNSEQKVSGSFSITDGERTEDGSYNSENGGGSRRNAKNSDGPSGGSSYGSNNDHDSIGGGSFSNGAGGVSGGSSGRVTDNSRGSNRSTNRSSTDGDDSKSSSRSNARASQRTSGTSTKRGDETIVNGTTRGRGGSGGNSSGSSTRYDETTGETTSSYGSSDSKASGGNRAGVDVTISPNVEDREVNFRGHNKSDGSSRSGVFVSGPAGSYFAKSSQGGDASQGSGGTLTSSLGDSSLDSNWRDRSSGDSSNSYRQDTSNGFSAGSSSGGGTRRGSGDDTPDGSSANASEDTNSSSNAFTTNTKVTELTGSLIKQTYTGTHEASGGTNRSVDIKDDEVTSATNGGGSGGENTETRTSRTDTPDGYSTRNSKLTTTGGMQDGTDSGTDKQEVSTTSIRETYTPREVEETGYNFTDYAYGTELAVDLNTTELTKSETVTHSPDSSHGSASLHQEISDEHKELSYEQRDYQYESQDPYHHTRSLYTTRLTRSTNDSSYNSSHDNGPHGAVGGKFESTTTSSSVSSRERQAYREGDLESGSYDGASGYHRDLIHPPVAPPEFIDLVGQGIDDFHLSNSGEATAMREVFSHTSSEGSYEDTARGRVGSTSEERYNFSYFEESLVRDDIEVDQHNGEVTDVTHMTHRGAGATTLTVKDGRTTENVRDFAYRGEIYNTTEEPQYYVDGNYLHTIGGTAAASSSSQQMQISQESQPPATPSNGSPGSVQIVVNTPRSRGGLITGGKSNNLRLRDEMLAQYQQKPNTYSADNREKLASPLRRTAAWIVETTLSILPGGTAAEAVQLANGENFSGGEATTRDYAWFGFGAWLGIRGSGDGAEGVLRSADNGAGGGGARHSDDFSGRKTPDVDSAAPRRAPAHDNYRGRFNAERHAQGKPRLPDDYDAHHRIPQEYRDHPGFADFDFDAPGNIQGVKGSRADVNTHQDITNRWADFRLQNPDASRSQIEDFASQIDSDFADHWFD